MKNKEIILELRNVTKKYPGVTALNNVSFKLRKGEILSLVGENGAGKSTLLKAISGVIPHNKFDGKIYYKGNETNFSNVKDSEKQGIAIIHQELAISPYLSIAENMFIGSYKSKFSIVNWNEMIKRSKYYLKVVGLDKNPLDIAGSLSVADQQLLEIAKALSKKAELLILDEPTSSLNDKDSYALLDTIKRLRNETGISCMFVSHKLKEVEYVSDAITIIRDGNHISDYDSKRKKIPEEKLIKDIVGRSLDSKYPPKDKNRKIGKVKLEVKNLSVEDNKIRDKMVVQNSSFDVKAGEIVGISGLVGSGRSEMMMNVFGHSFGIRRSGTVLINGHDVNLTSSQKAIKSKLMYASEDRKNIGLIQRFSIHENIHMASYHLYENKFGIINENKKVVNSLEKRTEVNIKVPNIFYNVETLSGGNQQKVLIAKALTTKFDILIIDEPTKGIDVGSKFEIYKILNELAAKGKAIVVVSSEIDELIGITDRIFVMSQGVIKGQLSTKKASPEAIMKIAIGTQRGETHGKHTRA